MLLRLEICLISQKENPGYIAKAHDWTKHVNYTKEAIDSCSKINYNETEILQERREYHAARKKRPCMSEYQD